MPQENTKVKPLETSEYLARMRDQYVRAKTRTDRERLLTEAMTVTNYHRKTLIRAWRRPDPVKTPRRSRRGRRRQYRPATVRTLKAI